MQNDTTLSYLPVGMFGGVMGLAGLSGAWRLAYRHLAAPLWISQVSCAAAIAALVAMLVGYAVKAFSGWEAVRAEFLQPVASNLLTVRQAPDQVSLAWIVPVVGMLAVPRVIPLAMAGLTIVLFLLLISGAVAKDQLKALA